MALNDYESEALTLGGLMIDNSVIGELNLTEEHFAFQSNKLVFRAISDLIASNKPADMMTVSDKLGQMTGGDDWLVEVGKIVNNTPSAKNIKAYADIVKRKHLQRTVSQVAQELLDAAPSDGVTDAVNNAIRALMAAEDVKRKYRHSFAEAAAGGLDLVERAYEAEGGIVGVPTGLTKLDEALGGFHDSDLIVIGARPAMGKTAFLLNCANAANSPVGVFSTEQPSDQIGMRLMSLNGRVSLHRMRTGNLDDADWARLADAATKLRNIQGEIYDRSGIHITELITQARRMAYEYNVGALYFDYIQRIKADSRLSKIDQVRIVCESLKELARELDIPVVALSQVNRSVEARPDKRPRMGDLSDSSAVEKEADVVALLYRDEVYNEDTDQPGTAEIIIDKNRHGPTGMIKTQWRGDFLQFSDFEVPYGY